MPPLIRTIVPVRLATRWLYPSLGLIPRRTLCILSSLTRDQVAGSRQRTASRTVPRTDLVDGAVVAGAVAGTALLALSSAVPWHPRRSPAGAGPRCGRGGRVPVASFARIPVRVGAPIRSCWAGASWWRGDRVLPVARAVGADPSRRAVRCSARHRFVAPPHLAIRVAYGPPDHRDGSARSLAGSSWIAVDRGSA